jgi:hypothetical protein
VRRKNHRDRAEKIEKVPDENPGIPFCLVNVSGSGRICTESAPRHGEKRA